MAHKQAAICAGLQQVGQARAGFIGANGRAGRPGARANGLAVFIKAAGEIALGAIVDDPAYIPENGSGWAVTCRDTESSFENRSAGVGPIDCKGFDLP